jgi:hypothetical protein
VFKVLVQPTQDVQHENAVGDVDAEVGEGVGEALHLSTVVVDAEVTLNEASKGGVNVEGAGFMVAEEVVLQGQPVIVRQSSATGGGRGRHRRRRLDQGCHGAGLLDEDGSRALLLLQEHGGGKDPGVGGIVPFLRGGGGDDHDVKFLLKLGGLGSLAVIIGGHRRWWRGSPEMQRKERGWQAPRV